jgi:hypothetical protein
MPVSDEQLDNYRDNWPLITASPRPSRLVPFPRNGEDGKPLCEVRMVLLTQAESMACAAAAEVTARSKLGKGNIPGKDEIGKGYLDVYVSASSVEILSRACKHPDDPKFIRPFFWKKSDIESELLPDEIAVLITEYAILQSLAGPMMNALTDAGDLQAVIDAIAEGGERFPFGKLSWDLKIQLFTTMARRCRSSPTDSSSPGTPLASG